MNNSKALKRLETLSDDGSFTEIDAYAKSADGSVEVVAGFGTVNECAVYAFSQDVTVDSGAVSVAQCAKIKKIYELALKTGCPVIGVYDSNGVKLTEGFEVMNAYGDLVKASTSMSGVCPQISIVAGSCLGTSALIANMADVVVAVKDADFYVTAPSEDYCQKKAMKQELLIFFAILLKMQWHRLKILLRFFRQITLPLSLFEFEAPSTFANDGDDAMAVINSIADANSVVELKGGYSEKKCKTALATVMGTTVGFVAFEGEPICPCCSYKAEAMVKLCDAYSIPVVTLVNANGTVNKPGKENQCLTAFTKLTSAYATATTPKISVITGNAVGLAYIVLAGKGSNADFTFAWDKSVASPLPTESAVQFLFNDRLANSKASKTLKKNMLKRLLDHLLPQLVAQLMIFLLLPIPVQKLFLHLIFLQVKEKIFPRKHSVK